ncbi:MAG: hypothetical protein JOS17DRAFT_781357 [Linnemannia elongata]|nr:MAG: hypothetical protein JOS17DRAFT_781357 [Linnemannia elongata]
MKPKTLISVPPCRQAHKLVPIEVWEHILQYLYPSQLSRISMVNKNFCAIVSSLEVWSHMFVIAYGPKAHLRTLVGVSKSKSYMMFMCSSSLHICERCFGLTGYNVDGKFRLPLPIPVLLPKRSTDTVKYLGERFEPNFTIRMCLFCRQNHISIYEEPLPRCAENSKLDEYQVRQQYPCTRVIPSFRHFLSGLFRQTTSIDEAIVLQSMRRHFGGDVGIKAFKESTEVYDEKTEARIRWYQLQE